MGDGGPLTPYVLTALNCGSRVLALPPPVTTRSWSAPTTCTAPKHRRPSEITVADGAIERAENRHLLGRERLLTQAHELRLALGRGLHRSDKRHLVLRALPGLAARALAAQVGVGDFDPAVELAIVFTHAHDLHERVLHEPGGLVENPQVAHQLEGRHVVLGLAQQVHGQEPAREPQLGGSKVVPLMTLHW